MASPPPLTEFTLFPTLATELRLKIWAVHLQEPRIVEVFAPPSSRYRWGILPTTKIPPLFHINRESRQEAHKAFKMVPGVTESRYLRPQAIINFDIDTVFFSQWGTDWLNFKNALHGLELPKNIKSLAVPIHLWSIASHTSRRDGPMCSAFDFPALEELVTLAVPRQKYNTCCSRRVWYKESREVDEVTDLWESDVEIAQDCDEFAMPRMRVFYYHTWDWLDLRSSILKMWEGRFQKDMEKHVRVNILRRQRGDRLVPHPFQNRPEPRATPKLRVIRAVAEESERGGGKMAFVKKVENQNVEKATYNEETGHLTFRLGERLENIC